MSSRSRKPELGTLNPVVAAIVKEGEEESVKVPLNKVTLHMCGLCLDGAGGECHVPGCVFWMTQAPGIPIRNRVVSITEMKIVLKHRRV